MKNLELGSSDEISHGRTRSVGRGVADGLLGECREQENIPESHRSDYEEARRKGEKLRAGMIYELTRDRRTNPAPLNDCRWYERGREIGNQLRDQISEAQRS